MARESRVGREAKIVIKVNDGIKNKFQAICDSYGLTMSTMAAYLIGKYVQEQERLVMPMQQEIKATVTKVMSDEFQKMYALTEEGSDFKKTVESVMTTPQMMNFFKLMVEQEVKKR